MRNFPKGFSTIEVMMLIIIILAVLIGFGGYIQRSLNGRWKAAGDAFGQGKQYDPRGFGTVGQNGGTLDCFYDQGTGHWVMEDCYRTSHCDCTLISGTGIPLLEYDAQCTACKQLCWDDARCN